MAIMPGVPMEEINHSQKERTMKILVRDNVNHRSETIEHHVINFLVTKWGIEYESQEYFVLMLAISERDMETVDSIAWNWGIEIEFLDMPVSLDKDYGMSNYENEFAIDTSDMSEFESDLHDSNVPRILELFA